LWWLAVSVAVACLPPPRALPSKEGGSDLAPDTGSPGDSGQTHGSPYDVDGDGYDGEAHGGEDCDDTDPDIYPGATEIWYDGVDSDCNGGSDYDADSDGYETRPDTKSPSSDTDTGDTDTEIPDQNDCDDEDASIYPWDLDEDGVFDGCGWRSLGAGLNHTCGIQSSGKVACWGFGTDGADRPAFFSEISGGDDVTCGRTVSDRIDCWGSDAVVASGEPEGEYLTVSTGTRHACALYTWGAPYCWGATDGEAPDMPLLAISAGEDHTCGITTNKTAICWGSDSFSQISNIASGNNWSSISTGRHTTCTLGPDGLACWGLDAGGIVTNKPINVFTSVAVGADFACVTQDAEPWTFCWGAEAFGQVMAPMIPLTGITAGDQHACGIRTDGHVECWGRDDHGQASPP